MILLISSPHCGSRPAWGLPTLPNCLLNLGHILSLTQKFNYQNYSSRLLRSPGLCLRARRVYLLPQRRPSRLTLLVPAGLGMGRPRDPGSCPGLQGVRVEDGLSFLICKMVMQKDKDRLIVSPRCWPHRWGLLVLLSQRRFCLGIAAHAGVTLDNSFLTLRIPSTIMTTLSTFSPLIPTILVQVTIISQLGNLLASQLDSPPPALPSPNVPISQLEGFFKMQS